MMAAVAAAVVAAAVVVMAMVMVTMMMVKVVGTIGLLLQRLMLNGGSSHAYQERNLESRCQKSRNND